MCSAADAIANSMTPGIAPSARRMKSSVRPISSPSRHTGIQLVTACSSQSGPIASRISTSGSRSSSMPPRVKRISGSAFSAIHCSLSASSWATSTAGSCSHVVHSVVSPSRWPRLYGWRTLVHTLPVSSNLSSGTTVSSATEIRFHPRPRKAGTNSSCVL